jgi:hypothetical protein
VLAGLAPAAQPEPSHSNIGSGAVTATTATLILAILTGVLAVAAFGAILVNLQLHRAELREREAAAFRAAIIEQLEECRAWVGAPPERQANAARRLVLRRPQFAAVGNLMATVTLEQPCLDRLMARVAGVRDWSEQQSELVSASSSQPDANPTEWAEVWHLQVTRRQEVAGLLLGAATVRGHFELAATLRRHPALVPRPWKPSRAETEVGEVTQGGMPPYPDGAAYQPWSPSAQDAWAERVSAAMSEQINVALQAGRL